MTTLKGRAVDTDGCLRGCAAASSVPSSRLIDHNETSTCVLNYVISFLLGMREMCHSALLIVDAVSSMAMADLNTDEWRVDVAITGSQKGLMLPPGMAILSISPRAWEAYSRSKAPRLYWYCKQMKDAMDGGGFRTRQPLRSCLGSG